jgi:hypothetical protein
VRPFAKASMPETGALRRQTSDRYAQRHTALLAVMPKAAPCWGPNPAAGRPREGHEHPPQSWCPPNIPSHRSATRVHVDVTMPAGGCDGTGFRRASGQGRPTGCWLRSVGRFAQLGTAQRPVPGASATQTAEQCPPEFASPAGAALLVAKTLRISQRPCRALRLKAACARTCHTPGPRVAGPV